MWDFLGNDRKWNLNFGAKYTWFSLGKILQPANKVVFYRLYFPDVLLGLYQPFKMFLTYLHATNHCKQDGEC